MTHKTSFLVKNRFSVKCSESFTFLTHDNSVLFAKFREVHEGDRKYMLCVLTSFLSLRWYLEVDERNTKDSIVGLDHFAVHIFLVANQKLIPHASVLDLVGRLDSVVLEMTVFARERRYDDISIERDAS